MRCYPLLALYELQHTSKNWRNAFSILIGFDFFACENVNQQGNHLIYFYIQIHGAALYYQCLYSFIENIVYLSNFWGAKEVFQFVKLISIY